MQENDRSSEVIVGPSSEGPNLRSKLLTHLTTVSKVRFISALVLILIVAAIAVIVIPRFLPAHKAPIVKTTATNIKKFGTTPTTTQPTTNTSNATQTTPPPKTTTQTKTTTTTSSSSTSSSSNTSSSSGVPSGFSGLLSGAYDLGWSPIGSAAPFSRMNEDFLFALETENGSGLDTHLLNTAAPVTTWVSNVHAGHNLAFITIGGSSDQNWQYACDSTNQAAFVSNLINYVISNGFDGLDIDMEDDSITATNPPVALWTGCAEAIISAAHAATTKAGKTPIVSEDIITNWEGPWLQPYETTVDQFNLMTYGDTCSSATSCPSFASDVSATAKQLCPSGGSCTTSATSRFVLGVDMGDNPGTLSSCGYASAYAKAQGYKGVFDWYLGADQQLGSTFPCQTAIAANE